MELGIISLSDLTADPHTGRPVAALDRLDDTLATYARPTSSSSCRPTNDDDLVFCHPQTGRPYDASKSRVRFKQALKRAGLRETRFHDLRHTYGTLMAAAGTPLRTLQGWMGHRDYKTTEIYANFAPDPTQAAVWAERAFGSARDLTGDAAQPGRLF